MSPTAIVRFSIVLMLVLPGVLALLLGIFFPHWLNSSGGTSWLRRMWGATGVRLFYTLLGVLLLACGLLGLLDPLGVLALPNK